MKKTRGRRIGWTAVKIKIITDMAHNGDSNQKIADRLGISRDSVRIKLNELGIKKPSVKRTEISPKRRGRWNEGEKALLRKAYKRGDSKAEIMELFAGERDFNSIRNAAFNMGLKKNKKANGKAGKLKLEMSDEPNGQKTSSKPIDMDLMALHRSSGLTPFEAHLLTGSDKEELSQAFKDAGWVDDKKNPHARIKLRKEIEARAEDLIGYPIDRKNGDHAMTLLMLASWKAGRDIVEIAKLAIYPLPFVERVFSLLDMEGLWPVTDAMKEMKADEYMEVAVICREQMEDFELFMDVR